MVIFGQIRTKREVWVILGTFGTPPLDKPSFSPIPLDILSRLKFLIMAKLSSLFKFEGTVNDVTVLKKSGVIRRRGGGLSKERIATDPALSRVRENNKEFGMLVKASGLVRETFADLKLTIRLQSVHARLSALFTTIKNMDTTSDRGYRQVAIGIASPEGKSVLDGFAFNQNATIKTTLMRPYDLDTTTGKVMITGLTPVLHTLGGVGANTVSFQAYWAKIDFATAKSTVSISNQVKLNINSTSSDVELNHAAPPDGSGISVFVLSIAFLQNVNGKDYPLQNGAFNAADIIAVI